MNREKEYDLVYRVCSQVVHGRADLTPTMSFVIAVLPRLLIRVVRCAVEHFKLAVDPEELGWFEKLATESCA